MTTFIVALFLPKTINFQPGIPSKPAPPSRKSSLITVSGNTSLSILAGPITPSLREDEGLNPFFTPAAASTSALHALPLTSDPPILARTDSFAPEWGHSTIFNQPFSRAEEAPPSTILAYAKVQEMRAAKSHDRYCNQPRNGTTDYASKTKESKWTVERAIQGNGGLNNAIEAAAQHHLLGSWGHLVGTVGFPTDDLDQDIKDQIAEKLENDHHCLPVFVNDSDFDGHYRHYCKTILWPVLHYQIPDHPKSKAYEDHSWIYYVKINEAFAEQIISSYKHGDTIWIHDYHLLLLPALIRKHISDAKIGFFLHSPFPSSEIFRCLATRKQLLQGILGADLVVLQAEEYAHHFLQTCSHLLYVEATDEVVQLDDRFVNVVAVPLGIVPQQMEIARGAPAVAEWTKILEERYKGKRLIVSNDKMEGTRGLKAKLLAYELFLDDNPQWKEKVVMIQVAGSTTTEKVGLDAAISDIVTRIDLKHSSLAHQPIVYLRQDIELSQHLALLTAADALMVTSLRDGMNLTCHEFIVCQDGKAGNKKHSPVILSEFTGAATVFSHSDIIPVNPWDFQQCANAITSALQMKQVEKTRRWEGLMEAVLNHDGVSWFADLSIRLDDAHESHQQRDIMSVPRLPLDALSNHYKDAETRLFILDYEGTLSSWIPSIQGLHVNSQRVIETLRELMFASIDNIVYITSFQSPIELEQIFHLLPGVGLIAENGCFVRPFTSDFSSEEWIDLADVTVNPNWKECVKQVLQYYVERIDGAEIEERNCSLIFRYNKVNDEDAEGANKLAGDCANHLNDSCKALGIRAIPMEKAVIVEIKDCNKHAASAKVLVREQLRLAGKAVEDLDTIWQRRVGSLSVTDSPAIGSHNSPTRGRSATVSSTHSRSLSRLSSVLESPPSGHPISPDHHHQSRKVSGNYTPAYAQGLLGRSAVEDGLSLSLSPEHTTFDSGYMSNDEMPPTGPQFLMVAGDGREDEAVFRWANMLSKKGLMKSVFSVSVGKRQTTEAKHTLTQGVPGLLNALGRLAKA